jgi:hypothetical protein
VANLWHIKESNANVNIQSFTRYAISKNWDEVKYVLITCTNLMYVLQCVVEASENEFKSSVH